MFDTHVYLGPSLDRETAQNRLPHAHYHPPIKCGDIIRLLRLSPKQILIIDGFYESVPAAWHKEILLALECGIHVIGAASIGALRAAELHHYGMQGIGQVFEDFKRGILNDDDEVAVLHRDHQDHFSPINDAMVNIRYTCQEALSQQIISLEMHDSLLTLCKTQFYPYRSLLCAAKQLLNDFPLMAQVFIDWLSTHGIIDIKKRDALLALEYCAKHSPIACRNLDFKTPMTMFLRNTTYYANVTPFSEDLTELTTLEKQLQLLHRDAIKEYRLVAELAHLSRCLLSLKTEETMRIDSLTLISHIKDHQLYLPTKDFAAFDTRTPFEVLPALILQSICLGHIRREKIEAHVPVIAHYYELDALSIDKNRGILRILLVLLFSIEIQMASTDISLSTKALHQELKGLFIRRAYKRHESEAWLHPKHIDNHTFFSFLYCYFKITTAYFSESSDSVYYFKWIYDAYAIYTATIAEQQNLSGSLCIP
jgi:hypothetical protein